MRQELHMMKGIQGSGKSTLAKELLAKIPNCVRINNDELRLLMFNRAFDEKDTKDIDAAREYLIEKFLEKGRSVIVDNMNLSPKHEERYRKYAEHYKCDFKIHDLTGVSLRECIDRDKKRDRPVGEKVIRNTYRQFVEKKPPVIPYLDRVPEAIICDLDGTLALMKNRSPYEEEKSDQDDLNVYVSNAIYHMANKKILSYDRPPSLILLSGRDEGRGREATERWLLKYNISYDYLYMRAAGDMRSDDIVKREFYEGYIKGKYNVIAVFDDRLRVCRLWYELGLPLFRVGDPDADF